MVVVVEKFQALALRENLRVRGAAAAKGLRWELAFLMNPKKILSFIKAGTLSSLKAGEMNRREQCPACRHPRHPPLPLTGMVSGAVGLFISQPICSAVIQLPPPVLGGVDSRSVDLSPLLTFS